MPLPAATPPSDPSSLDGEPPPAPAPPAPPVSTLTPGPPLAASAAPVPEPRPPAPAPAPKPPGEGWSRGRVIAIVATVVLLVGSVMAALVLSGGSDKPKPAAARDTPAKTTSTPAADADLSGQVKTLDDLMKASKRGRAAAVKGDTKAAIANRSKLLKDLERLSSAATDARLKAGLRSFTAAIRESLRQNRDCGAKCSTSELETVNRLKEQAVRKLNPLLRKYAKTSYRSRDI
jgi:hypothetical protein